MSNQNNDVQVFISRLNNVVQRLEAVAENASIANVKMLDGLNTNAVKKSVSSLESLCIEAESRLERLRGMRRAG